MNVPVRKHLDEKGNKTYTGDIISLHPNRRQRRKMLQKQERNPLFMTTFHTNTTRTNNGMTLLFKNHVQKVFNKKKNKFITILHTRYL